MWKNTGAAKQMESVRSSMPPWPSIITPQSLAPRLRFIRYGTTTTYGALAQELGNPQASRAVGLANGSNPIPIVIPCHRVIGADGSLTGFGGGLPIKAALLELERAATQPRLL